MFNTERYETKLDYLFEKSGCTDVREAVSGLLEEFYDSGVDIDKSRIFWLFSFLCEALSLNDELLDNDLCVVHENESERMNKEYRSEIKGPLMVVVDQIYAEESVNEPKLRRMLNKLCNSTQIYFDPSEEITITRKKTQDKNHE